MELLDLKANLRTETGGRTARASRREGKIPAVLYGPQTESVLLFVDMKDFEKIVKSGSSGQILFNLLIENEENSARSAMIKELQIHPVSRNIEHVDFYEIAMDRKITVKVPIKTTGKSKGVEIGGLLQIVRRELEVSCLPLEIPEFFELDITELDIGDSIHVNEISVEGNVEFPTDANFTVITVLSPKKEEEEEVEEEELEEVEGEEEAAEDVEEEKTG